MDPETEQRLRRLDAAVAGLGDGVASDKVRISQRVEELARSCSEASAAARVAGPETEQRLSRLDASVAGLRNEVAQRVEELTRSCGEASAAARVMDRETEQRLSRLDASVAGLGNDVANDRVRVEGLAQSQTAGIQELLRMWE